LAVVACLWLGLVAAWSAASESLPRATSRATVYVDDVAVAVEVVDTPRSRARGLQFRDALPADHGMLFVFERPAVLRFWMRNTPIDLDIGFFAADGRLLNIARMTAFDDRHLHASDGNALYALEVNRGWFARHGLGPGARLRIPSIE
jgi:uncharacterized membrane protein (UPF0127 family)